MTILGNTSLKTVKSVKPNLIFLYPLKTQKHLGFFWMCSVDIDIQHSEEIGYRRQILLLTLSKFNQIN